MREKRKQHYLDSLFINLEMTAKRFSEEIGLCRPERLYNVLRSRNNVSSDLANMIVAKFPDVNYSWLLTGKGEMLKPKEEEQAEVKFYDPEYLPEGKRLIPLWDDVSSIGGKLNKGYSAKINSDSPPSEWIDPGGWFKNVTNAIRHYGDSMIEYQPGCILALKEVQDRRLIIPGKDYVIETSEYRVTKKVQLASNPDYLRVHSTNDEKYDDGTLIHQPFDIPWELITNIFEVIGYVVKKGNGTMVFTNQK